MIIELNHISIRELVEGYENKEDEGVVGYSGALDIRPPYQREFVYKDKQRDAVIDTVTKNFPLNVLYWVKKADGTFEVLDGQQRTISICSYVNNEYSINYRFFHNLTEDEQNSILNYELSVYVCEGTEREKLDWFRTVNISGEKLTEQELRNAVYAGIWLTDAKRYFSKTAAPAVVTSANYVKGNSLRQDYLEKALRWISNNNIEEYMAQHQHDRNANELWLYFRRVMEWVKVLFPDAQKEMQGVEWGPIYNLYHDNDYDAQELRATINDLMLDEEVQRKSGVFYYLFDNDERHLNLRQFPERIKREVYTRQDGICVHCKEEFSYNEMEADHITPWSQGGKTTHDNCQILCRTCNRQKSNS